MLKSSQPEFFFIDIVANIALLTPQNINNLNKEKKYINIANSNLHIYFTSDQSKKY